MVFSGWPGSGPPLVIAAMMLRSAAFYFNIPVAEPMIPLKESIMARRSPRPAKIDPDTPARNPRYAGATVGEVIRQTFRPAKPEPIKPPKKPRNPAGA